MPVTNLSVFVVTYRVDPSTFGARILSMEIDLMVVDDDDILHEIIERFMSDTEYTVRCFSNGMEAKDILGEFNVRVMLVDFNMPGMNGLEFVSIVASMAECSATQVYLCSSVDLPQEVADRALSVGALPLNKCKVIEDRFLTDLCAA